ncbi:MAG: PKD domain-containing protein [Actinomycetota bacterium]
MSGSLRERFRPEDRYARILGVVLVAGGLVVFLVVFFALFPVLRDPVSTYERWFPPEEEESPVEVEPAGPRAGFYWVVEAHIAGSVARLEDLSEAGDAPIVRWTWELGDGTVDVGADVEHEYTEPGDYRVRLEVEDENGQTDRADGRIAVPGEGREEGEIEPEEESLDLSGIEASIEDLVGTLTRAVRTSIVIGLFALAAGVLTLVGWRVTRIGVMLLHPPSGESPKKRGLEQQQTTTSGFEAAAPQGDGSVPPPPELAQPPERYTPQGGD